MIRMRLLVLMIVAFGDVQSQEVPVEQFESEFENRTEEAEDSDDDELIQQLQTYVLHPMNLNHADEEDLHHLRILSAAQIENFVRYRLMLGKLLHIYELQAVPGWNVELIRKLLPFVTIEDDKVIDPKMLLDRWTGGNDNLLIRISKEFKSFIRYRHSYKNLLQFNVTTERDAGEKFLDFTSIHFFARDLGLIKRLAIGDFVISMGQGLIMSQGMSLKKSANVLGIKKQNEILRPYSSAGEYNFHRGIASTLKWKNWQTTLFLSMRKLDANIEAGAQHDNPVVTSIITSGFHRTENEKEDMKNLRQLALGGNISFRSPQINAGINAVSYRFSIPIQKQPKPYNAFAFSGDRLSNLSVQYDRSFMNAHLFGEYAIDDEGNTASIHGMLVSLDRKLDCSFLYRKLSPKFRSFYAGSFTENSTPVNENGIYAGLSFRPSARWKLDLYADIFRFPFLKYQVSEPSSGKDLFYQVTWTPSKTIEVYGRFKSEERINTNKKQIRFQLTWNISREIMIRERYETVAWNEKGGSRQFGFLALTDFQYRPFRKFFRFKCRLSNVETEGSEAKIYAYDSDILYSGSVSGYAGKGLHLRINLYSDLNQVIHILKKQKMQVGIWFSWTQFVYFQQPYLPGSSITPQGSTGSKFTGQIIVSR